MTSVTTKSPQFSPMCQKSAWFFTTHSLVWVYWVGANMNVLYFPPFYVHNKDCLHPKPIQYTSCQHLHLLVGHKTKSSL